MQKVSKLNMLVLADRKTYNKYLVLNQVEFEFTVLILNAFELSMLRVMFFTLFFLASISLRFQMKAFL